MSELAKLLRAIEHDDLEGFVSVGRETEDGPDWVVCDLGYHRVSDITPKLLPVVVRFSDDEADKIRDMIRGDRLNEMVCARLVPFRHFVGWLARELGGQGLPSGIGEGRLGLSA